MLKELSVKEALQLLAEKYPEPVWGISDREFFKKDKVQLCAVDIQKNNRFPFYVSTINDYDYVSNFSIEVSDEYRYMTQQEVVDWVCLHGYKGYQMKPKGGNTWWKPYNLEDSDDIERYQYRTIQEINGKIVYGEPQEFKVRVE